MVATEFCQIPGKAFRLDALSHDRRTDTRTQPHDGLEDPLGGRVFSEAADKLAVKLDRVDVEFADVRQVGVAGSEVVECDPETLGTERADCGADSDPPLEVVRLEVCL